MVTISRCSFDSNTATNGPHIAILEVSGPIIVSECQFINGKAINQGGAIGVSNGNIQLYGCIFSNNMANKGGAIAMELSNVVINGVQISNSVSAAEGGHIQISYDCQVSIENTQLINGTAKSVSYLNFLLFCYFIILLLNFFCFFYVLLFYY